MTRQIEMTITWGSPRAVEVRHHDRGLDVEVDGGLSTHQMEQVCAHLGDDGPGVLRAWRQSMGLDSE